LVEEVEEAGAKKLQPMVMQKKKAKPLKLFEPKIEEK